MTMSPRAPRNARANDAASPGGGPAFLVAGLAVAILSAGARAVPAAPADSSSFRLEVGAATQVSNEQFYESSIDDTTFQGRQLLSTPETRVTAVGLAELVRLSEDGRWSARVSPDFALGDGVTRLGAVATLRLRPSGLLRLTLEPRAGYRNEETFGQVRRDWRASVVGRMRLLSLDESSALRVTAGSEVVRSLEGGDPFVLSGTSARAAVAFDRSPLFGWNWDVEYGAIARVFRDSTFRDHVEHHLIASARQDFLGRGLVQLDLSADRRMTLRSAPTSRDRFSEVRAHAEGEVGFGAGWALRPSAGIELTRYDDPDSLLDFDYRITSTSLELRRDLGLAWRLSTGPKAEWLAAPWNPGEEYREYAWFLEAERLTGAGWLSLSPALGHRAYTDLDAGSSSALDIAALHSNFDFLELTGFLDQPLPGRLRARALVTLRAERHADPDQDARSLYFSMDLRRLF